MPKRSLENLTESMFYVLMAFGRGPMCGIDVVEFIEARTDGRIQMGPATVYTILGKFEKEGYIEEIAVEGRKRTYRITQRGMQAYREEVERLNRCVADAAAECEVACETEDETGSVADTVIEYAALESTLVEKIGSCAEDRSASERGLRPCPC